MCTAFCASINPALILTGRSLDYSHPTQYAGAQLPKGHLYRSVLENGVTWTGTQAVYTIDSVQTEYNVAFEGMNQSGLSMSGNLANASYPDGAGSVTISTDDMVNYVLSQAADLTQAAQLMTNVNIRSDWSYHYILFNRQGESLIVEYENGQALTYTNESSVLTNNPNLPYQLENQNNYANLRSWSSKAILPDQGDQFHGQGMLGLPGDWMSPSRFTRISSLLKHGLPHVTPGSKPDSVAFVKRSLDSVSLIKGIDSGSKEDGLPIYTQIQIIKDLVESVIYTRQYDDDHWSSRTVDWTAHGGTHVLSGDSGNGAPATS